MIITMSKTNLQSKLRDDWGGVVTIDTDTQMVTITDSYGGQQVYSVPMIIE